MSSKKTSLASPIAPEDIRRGHYVTVLNVIDQYFPCCLNLPGRREAVNIRMLPDFEAQPFKVTDVCLPFVTTVKHDGTPLTLDVRRYELARLDDAYARRVVRLLRAPHGTKVKRK
jgi:hypothetical protein